MAQEGDNPSISGNGSSALVQPDASVTPAAYMPALVSEDLALQAAMIGAGATKTYSDMSKPDKSVSTPGQPGTKADASDRKSRTQQKGGGRESDLSDSAQISSHNLGQVKQTPPIGKPENLVGQNSPTQSVVAEITSTNAPHITFKEHIPGKENIPSVIGTDEPAPSQPELTPASPLGSVQTAHLLQRLSEAELRVGIQAGEFGKIDIRTSVSQSQISARIYVEHGELGNALAEGIQQLREKLSVEHHMDAQVELYNTGSSPSNGSDRQQHQQQRTTQQNGPASRDADTSTPKADIVPEAWSTGTAMGLDMHI
jgi:hypothetical protein